MERRRTRHREGGYVSGVLRITFCIHGGLPSWSDKEHKASEDRERAQRIALEEEAALSEENNPRIAERRKMSAILEPQGLAIKDIPPDGHW